MDKSRVEKKKSTRRYFCENDAVPCASDPEKDGDTFCVWDKTKCPVTDLYIVESGDALLSDSRYKQVKSAPRNDG